MGRHPSVPVGLQLLELERRRFAICQAVDHGLERPREVFGVPL